MLNNIGAPTGLGVRAPAANPAGAPPAPAAPAPDDATGYAIERDTADHIATCRASYAVVSDQLNQILDFAVMQHPDQAAPQRSRTTGSSAPTASAETASSWSGGLRERAQQQAAPRRIAW